MLLARIYDCLPLICENCIQPIRLIAFIMEPPVVAKILTHFGVPTESPGVFPARASPQVEMGFDQVNEGEDWPDMDQTAETPDAT